MINVEITPSKRRFGRLLKRKQWQITVRGRNGEPLSFSDTYANTGDVLKLLHMLRDDEMVIRTHYVDGVKATTLPGRPF